MVHNNRFIIQFVSIASLLVVVFVFPPVLEAKKDRNVPHGHFGVLTQYQPGPFDLTLQDSDEEELTDGKTVMKQRQDVAAGGAKGGSGGAICVQDIDAPKQAVWNQILRLDEYAKKVPKVAESKNYEEKRGDDKNCFTLKTKQRLGILPGYSYENYYEHTYTPKDDSLTWHLDYNKKSDFYDVAGHWHLEDHPHKTGCTRVYYACDIEVKSSVPRPVLNFISKSALRQATAWVKKESELAPNEKIPNKYILPEVEEEEEQDDGRFSFANKFSNKLQVQRSR